MRQSGSQRQAKPPVLEAAARTSNSLIPITLCTGDTAASALSFDRAYHLAAPLVAHARLKALKRQGSILRASWHLLGGRGDPGGRAGRRAAGGMTRPPAANREAGRVVMRGEGIQRSGTASGTAGARGQMPEDGQVSPL